MTAEVPRTAGQRRNARRPAARGLRRLPRGRPAAPRTCGTSTCRSLGGIVLHRGNIAEMVTGEGKTLVATLPAYLNALEGKGVHIVTVNDYLARRDCEWMLPIYRALGIDGRLHPERHGPRRPPQGLRLRHHLRHQQRVRLRLPARQHEAGPLGRRQLRPVLPAVPEGAQLTPSSTRWTTSSSTRRGRR